MKILIYDVETTGLDSQKSAIHQLSGKVVIDGEVKETFNLKLRPHDGAEITDEALRVSGVTREQIAGYTSHMVQFQKFKMMLEKYVSKYDKADKFYLCGFNIGPFDNQFLRAWFARCGEKWFGSYFWSNYLDCIVLATPYLVDKRPQMKDFKQSSVAEALGVKVEEEKLHDAFYDIELSHQIYDKVCGKY